jgi:hypothetical protein
MKSRNTLIVCLVVLGLLGLFPPRVIVDPGVDSPKAASRTWLFSEYQERIPFNNTTMGVTTQIDVGRLLAEGLLVVAVCGTFFVIYRSEEAMPGLAQRLGELTKSFSQFRESLNDIIGFQQNAVQAARERTENEAGQALIQEERPA